MRGADGTPLRGEVIGRKVKLASPTSAERVALGLNTDDQIVRINRTRFDEQRPFAYEQACLPDRRFPGLAAQTEVPDEREELAQPGCVGARAEVKSGWRLPHRPRLRLYR